MAVFLLTATRATPENRRTSMRFLTKRPLNSGLSFVVLVNSKRLSASEIAAVYRLVTQHRDTFLEAWHAHFDA